MTARAVVRIEIRANGGEMTMAISSGTRNALSEAATWIFVAVCAVAGVLYYSEVKAVVAPLVGLEIPSGDGAINGQRPAYAGRARAQIAQSDVRTTGNAIELRASRGGHFLTEAFVNGRRINVMVDTGATVVALTYEDAQDAGLYIRPGDFNHRFRTANGLARMAIVTLDRVAIGDIEVRNVRASVSQPGMLSTTLLGMSFLSRLRRAEMRQGRLILEN